MAPRALLDVNVLIALLDQSHLHHNAASLWMARNSKAGWASCPLTQNGCLRILSLTSYPNAQATAVVAKRLAEAADTSLHEFWPDSVSLLGGGVLRWDRVLTSRQVTDVYLLALATANGGRLITFDRGISIAAVPTATAANLLVLG